MYVQDFECRSWTCVMWSHFSCEWTLTVHVPCLLLRNGCFWKRFVSQLIRWCGTTWLSVTVNLESITRNSKNAKYRIYNTLFQRSRGSTFLGCWNAFSRLTNDVFHSCLKSKTNKVFCKGCAWGWLWLVCAIFCSFCRYWQKNIPSAHSLTYWGATVRTYSVCRSLP